jgi:phosphoribosyl 1,2-cyclic phosphate phosphodiesterase
VTLKVTMLGCGGSAGVPSIGGLDGGGDWGACDPREPRNQRTRSSIVLEWDGFRLLVDTSPDMRGQFLANRIGKVDAVLYTHAHADHVAGIDDVRLLNRALGAPLPCYGTVPTLEYLAHRYEYAFRPHTGSFFFRPVLTPHIVTPGSEIEIHGRRFQIFEQDHHVTLSIGFRTGGLAYSTDVVRVAEPVFDLLQGVDSWVLAAFQRNPHPTHLHVDGAIEWSRRVGARRTVLTHMGPDLDWGWLVKKLPDGVEPGHDGLVLTCP